MAATRNELGYVSVYNEKTKTWYYEDTLEPVEETIRSCKVCGNHRTEEGHDACFGELPGVAFACCGHGLYDWRFNHYFGYVKYKDGSRLSNNLFKKHIVRLI